MPMRSTGGRRTLPLLLKLKGFLLLRSPGRRRWGLPLRRKRWGGSSGGAPTASVLRSREAARAEVARASEAPKAEPTPPPSSAPKGQSRSLLCGKRSSFWRDGGFGRSWRGPRSWSCLWSSSSSASAAGMTVGAIRVRPPLPPRAKGRLLLWKKRSEAAARQRSHQGFALPRSTAAKRPGWRSSGG